MKPLKIIFLLSFTCFLCFFSCTTVDVYERSLPVPGHAWYNSFRPTFDFTIKDTSSPYQSFLILRHNEKYHFSNIYVNISIEKPGQDSVQKFQLDLPLAGKDGKWLATGMDDIYEHRIGLFERPQYFKAGHYKFTVEQIMRENPLQNVYDVGIRVEKQ